MMFSLSPSDKLMLTTTALLPSLDVGVSIFESLLPLFVPTWDSESLEVTSSVSEDSISPVSTLTLLSSFNEIILPSVFSTELDAFVVGSFFIIESFMPFNIKKINCFLNANL